MPSPLVWFLLLHSSNGQPYNGTCADYVSLPTGSVIAQFRDAIKKKDKDDGDAAILTPFKSSQLLVYKSKAAFFEGKEEPLKSSCPLDGLGKTEEDMLVVIVPELDPDDGLDCATPVVEIPPSSVKDFETMHSNKRDIVLGILMAKAAEDEAIGLSSDEAERLRYLFSKHVDVFRVDLGYDPPVGVEPLKVRIKPDSVPVRCGMRRYRPHTWSTCANMWQRWKPTRWSTSTTVRRGRLLHASFQRRKLDRCV
jgi:hypothetical protein